MSTNTTTAKEPKMAAMTLTRAELVAAIKPDPERLADLVHDASREYDRQLEKLDEQARWITEKMERLRASIARSRDTDPSALSINDLGELQGQGPELDRLCAVVAGQRAHVRRLSEMLGVSA